MRFSIELYSSFQKWIVFMSLVRVLHSQSCQMIERNDKTAPDTTSNLGIHANSDGCNNACLQEDSCVAARLQLSICLYWTSPSDIRDGAGSSFYVKSCQDATTQAPPPSSCSSTQSANTDASNHAIELPAVSLSSCQDVCKLVVDCQYFVFVQSSSSCQMYSTSSATITSQAGHTLGHRQSCDNGKQCCFDIVSDQTITESPAFTLTSSQTSCDDLCLEVTNCQASVFTGTTCKVFTATPVTTATTGATLYTKDCPNGASKGSFTHSDTCESSASTMAPLTTSLSFVLVALLWTRLFNQED